MPDEVILHFDVNGIQQVVSNLYENAVEYVNRNSVMELLFEDDRVTATIKNEGVSIPANELESIFDCFIRVRRLKPGLEKRDWVCQFAAGLAKTKVGKYGQKRILPVLPSNSTCRKNQARTCIAAKA